MANTPWTFSIEDTSSVIAYSPHGDGGSGEWTSTGWQPWFSDIGFMPGDKQALDGTGSSLHITAFPGAALSLQFYGTGIALYGNATCPYDVAVDDAPATTQDATYGRLYFDNTLVKGMHTVKLTAHASESNPLSFDRADILLTDAPPRWNTFLATQTDVVDYDDNWHLTSDWQIPSKSNPMPFYQKNKASNTASFTTSFQGSGIALYGARNWGNGLYTVTLDGVKSQYNSSTMWLIGDVLMFYQFGLDPSTTHNVTLTASGVQTDFRFNSLVVFTPNNTDVSSIPGATSPSPNSSRTIPTSPTSPGSTDGPASPQASTQRPNSGVIAGAVIAGVAALAILVAIIFWCMRYSRRRRNSETFRTTPSPVTLPINQTGPPSPVTSHSGLTWCTTSSPSRRPSSKGQPPSHRPQLPPDLPPTSMLESGERSLSHSAHDGAPTFSATVPVAVPVPAASVPARSNPAETSSSVLVERLAQSIADRINSNRGNREDVSTYSGYERERFGPPPQYES
ncbi:hypothetical protein C8Q76DRAFT_797386 [Earliella scabrosa]|nr:hypothetical protein C8Q76DRAFT_797386 [Earliella scabrosa]